MVEEKTSIICVLHFSRPLIFVVGEVLLLSSPSLIQLFRYSCNSRNSLWIIIHVCGEICLIGCSVCKFVLRICGLSFSSSSAQLTTPPGM